MTMQRFAAIYAWPIIVGMFIGLLVGRAVAPGIVDAMLDTRAYPVPERVETVDAVPVVDEGNTDTVVITITRTPTRDKLLAPATGKFYGQHDVRRSVYKPVHPVTLRGSDRMAHPGIAVVTRAPSEDEVLAPLDYPGWRAIRRGAVPVYYPVHVDDI